jgi:hypothetical protein
VQSSTARRKFACSSGTGRLDSFPKLGFQDNEDGSSTEGCKIH